MPIDNDLSDAVVLPDPLNLALSGLMTRMVDNGAEDLKTALFGADVPTFGQVRKVGVADLKTAAERACPGAAIVALKELAGLMPRFTPETPVCNECGECSLSSIGGKIFSLSVGARCPICSIGQLELVPVKLRMVAWTDGHLTEPQTTHDLRYNAGWRLPLHDKDILAWADSWIDDGLERALRDAGTAIYAFLAYMKLGRKALTKVEDVPELLHDPKRFGLRDSSALAAAAKSAKAFVEAREVSNIPAKPFAIERFGRNLPSLTVAGREYLIEGRVGQGDRSDIFRAFWNHEPTQMVVLKICRALDESDLMKREALNLKAIQASDDPAAYFFSRILPNVIDTGTIVGPDGLERPVTVLHDLNLFDWTLENVIQEYPEGVDPRAMVWMWKRILTILAFTHRTGFVHGAILPGHVLLHAEHHAAMLLDWAAAVRYRGGKERIEIVSDGYDAYYPPEVFSKEAPTPETDIAMSARCMIAVLGGDPKTGELPDSVPPTIRDVLRLHARCGKPGKARRFDDALALEKAFSKIAENLYGDPKFVEFLMPRSKR